MPLSVLSISDQVEGSPKKPLNSAIRIIPGRPRGPRLFTQSKSFFRVVLGRGHVDKCVCVGKLLSRGEEQCRRVNHSEDRLLLLLFSRFSWVRTSRGRDRVWNAEASVSLLIVIAVI